MIGLPDGWDDDPDERRPADAAPFALQFEGKSKAAQLLLRAAEAPEQRPGLGRPWEGGRAVTAAPAVAPGPVAGGARARAAAPALASGPPPNAAGLGAGAGALGIDLPHRAAAGARAPFAPSALPGLAASFRASVRGGLVAQPGRNGTGVRLLRLAAPGVSGAAGAGAELLEAQLPGLAGGAGAAPYRGARPIVPRAEAAQALLDAHIDAGRGGPPERHAQEAFELLRALCGECGPGQGSRAPVAWPPRDVRASRGMARGVSAWLSRVNVQAVARHLERAPPAPGPSKVLNLGAAGDGGLVSAGLRRACHHLTANSVGRALRELGAIAGRAEAGEHPHFERLAGLVASCGGASSRGRERRQWLRQQVMEWRSVGVHKLMGSPLYNVYSLLAGDLDDVVEEALDWRAAFGMFLWYGRPSPLEDPLEGEGLLQAVSQFEAAVRRSGVACSFRPSPPYAAARPDAAARLGARDLHFSLLRCAVGLSDWRDLTHFDYDTHAARPMDVACSWHISLLVLALCGGDTASSAFQLLTQQYCFLLEAAGHWEWAVCAALFVRDDCARGAAVRGLLQRHARALGSVGGREVWDAVPRAWVRRAQARLHEASRDWLPAVARWLELGEAERALSVALAFLQGPAVAGHLGAALQRRAARALPLAPMAPPQRWLLALYEEHEAAAETSQEAWARACRGALPPLRAWARAAGPHAGPALAQLYWSCCRLRRYLLGVPW